MAKVKPTCKGEGCDNKAWKQGYCASCYMAQNGTGPAEPAYPVKDVRLAAIRPSWQPREKFHEDVAINYAERMQAGTDLDRRDGPPVAFTDDGATYHLGDGNHRRRAREILGHAVMPVEVWPNSPGLNAEDSAREYACLANQEHGIQRDPTYVQRAIVELKRLHPEWSQGLIAEKVGVKQSWVSRVLATHSSGMSGEGPVVGRDGRTIDTSNIGKRAEDDPEREPDPADPPPGKGDAWLPEEDEYLRDGLGLLVPPHMANVFQDAPDVLGIARLLEMAERRIESMAADGCPAGAHLRARLVECLPYEKGPLMPHLRRIIAEVYNSVPHAAFCVRCRYGRPMEEGKTCPECLGLGWVTKPFWLKAAAEWREQALEEFGPAGKPYDASVGAKGASQEAKALEALAQLTKFLPADIYKQVKASLEQITALLRREDA